MKVAVGPDQLGKNCRENVLIVNMDRLEDGLSRRCLSNKKRLHSVYGYAASAHGGK